MKITKNTYLIIILLLISAGLIWYGVSQTSFQFNFVWRSFLLNTVYFSTIALFGTLFYSMHILANAKWVSKIESVLISMGEVFVFLLVLYLILFLNLGGNYSWVENGSDKDWYLSITFFISRNVFILGGYALFCFFISKKALSQVSERKKILPAIFLMFFAVTILFYAYDWIVSLDQQWYSTLFGWYLFSGLLVAGLSAAILLVLVFEKRLKIDLDKRILKNLARYLFAFSMVWAYLWYVQYLLPWYTNKPEEVQYYTSRFESYSIIFYLGFVLSFVVPFILLISNFARKNKFVILLASISCIIGQWLDKAFYIFPVVDNGVTSLLFVGVGVFVTVSVLFWIVFKYRLKEKLN